MYGEYKYVTPEYEARLSKLATDLMLDRYLKTQCAAEHLAVIIPFPEQPDPDAA